jgi:VanZ family protein
VNPPAGDRGRASATALLAWVPAVLWAGVIFFMSSLPGSQIPGRFSTIGHLGEYAVLGALLVVPLRGVRPTVVAALVAVCLATAYGLTDELHQAFVPGRTPDVLDLATDVVGAVIGTAAAIGLVRWRSRVREDASGGAPD